MADTSVVQVQQNGLLLLPGGGVGVRLEAQPGNQGDVHDGTVRLWTDRVPGPALRPGENKIEKPFDSATLKGAGLVAGDSYRLWMLRDQNDKTGQDAATGALVVTGLLSEPGTHGPDEAGGDSAAFPGASAAPPQVLTNVLQVPTTATSFTVVASVPGPAFQSPPGTGELCAWLQNQDGSWVRAAQYDVTVDATPGLSYRSAPDLPPDVYQAESQVFPAPGGATLTYRTRNWLNANAITQPSSVTLRYRMLE